MKTGKIKSLLLTVFGCFYANIACFAASLFSDYGQIQNVQNYSTNPFWTPNSPYNQKMPQPVYVQGNAVSNDECIQIVTAAVTVQCAARNNCKDTSLSDIRPAVIVQLSGLPNKAYSTACIGYLDTVYESYVKQFGHSAPTRTVAFPESYGSGNNTFRNNNGSTIIQNPSKTTTPSWQQDINERTMELQRLQRQNGLGTEHVYATDYPTNFQDLSFTDRTDVLATGYAPYKDSHPYRTLKVYGTGEHCNSSEYANSQECMEYFCSIGGSKATSKECIKWRCSGAYDTIWQQGGTARTTYMGDNERECKCAINQKSDECMEFKCKQGGIYVESIECSKWLCDKEPGYATQHKETCNPEPKVVLKQNDQKVVLKQNDIEKITVIPQSKQTEFDDNATQEAIAKIYQEDWEQFSKGKMISFELIEKYLTKLLNNTEPDDLCKLTKTLIGIIPYIKDFRTNTETKNFLQEQQTLWCKKQYNQTCTKVGNDEKCCNLNTTNGECIPLCANEEFAKEHAADHCKDTTCITDGVCCKTNDKKCLTPLCANEEFAKNHMDKCKIKEEQQQPTSSDEFALCPEKFTKNKAETMFKNIPTPNIASAILLAKTVLKCINDINYKDYDTQNPAHGSEQNDNYILFTDTNDQTKFIKIWFEGTNHYAFDADHVENIWTAICRISGGDLPFGILRQGQWGDYVCKYKNQKSINDSTLKAIADTFNDVFSASKVKENAKISKCIKQDNTIRCLHEIVD